MRTLFADAGYWIALLYSGDQLHERATTVAAGLEPGAVLTTQMALAEALNHLAGRGERLRRLAAQMVRELEASRTCKSSLRQTPCSGLLSSATPLEAIRHGASQTARAFWLWKSGISLRRSLTTGISSRPASEPCFVKTGDDFHPRLERPLRNSPGPRFCGRLLIPLLGDLCKTHLVLQGAGGSCSLSWGRGLG